MPDRYPLVAHLPVLALPRNIEHVRLRLTVHGFQTPQLIALRVCRPAVYQSLVGEHGLRLRSHVSDSVEINVSARRAARSFFILQKDGQNLDAPERLFRSVGQLQKNLRPRVNESDGEGLLDPAVYHVSSLSVPFISPPEGCPRGSG